MNTLRWGTGEDFNWGFAVPKLRFRHLDTLIIPETKFSPTAKKWVDHSLYETVAIIAIELLFPLQHNLTQFNGPLECTFIEEQFLLNSIELISK